MVIAYLLKVKPKLFVTTLVFFCELTFSQSFIGSFSVSDTLTIPYYLHLGDDSSSTYSISGIYGSTETFSSIALNKENDDLITINEDRVIYTKTRAQDYSDFCSLSFSLKKSQIKKLKITSAYEAKISSEIICGNGEIRLDGVDEVKNKLANINTKIENNLLVKKLTSALNRKITSETLTYMNNKIKNDYAKEILVEDLDFIDFIGLREKNTIKLHFKNIKPLNIDDVFLIENGKATTVDNNIHIERINATKPVRLSLIQMPPNDLIFSINDIMAFPLGFIISEGSNYVKFHL
jgi:hypothetical protein